MGACSKGLLGNLKFYYGDFFERGFFEREFFEGGSPRIYGMYTECASNSLLNGITLCTVVILVSPGLAMRHRAYILM